jgi:hypothetical protein
MAALIGEQCERLTSQSLEMVEPSEGQHIESPHHTIYRHDRPELVAILISMADTTLPKGTHLESVDIAERIKALRASAFQPGEIRDSNVYFNALTRTFEGAIERAGIRQISPRYDPLSRKIDLVRRYAYLMTGALRRYHAAKQAGSTDSFGLKYMLAEVVAREAHA